MHTLAIDGELTIFTAARQKMYMPAFPKPADKLEINLANVTEIDTAGLQLLNLIKREAAQTGKTLCFIKHTKVVLDVLEFTNLARAFGDRVVLANNEE